jgi:hypothetical protein
MDVHKFRIKAGLHGADSSIEMDGRKLSCVRSLELKMDGGGLTELKLTLVAEAEVDGEWPEQTAIFRAPE